MIYVGGYIIVPHLLVNLIVRNVTKLVQQRIIAKAIQIPDSLFGTVVELEKITRSK
jgi:hypothetical protein